MKKRVVLVVVLILAATAGAYFWFRSGKKTGTVSFATATADYGYVARSITATGTVEPLDTVTVGAQVSGMVRNVYADFNDAVRKGQLLARIDPSIIEAQMKAAQATKANAESNYDYQQNNFERQTKLYDLGAISKADYQLATNQYYSAKASIENANAQVKLSERNLYYTEIYSPINGVVLNRNVSAGQTIASNFNAPTLFVIAKDLTKMLVNADVDEADIGSVKVGQNVTFNVDAFPDETFRGKVQNIYLHPSVSANVVTYTTLINVDNSSMKLKPGMTASIVVYTEEDSNALRIPSKAINFKPDSVVLKNYIVKRAPENFADSLKIAQKGRFGQGSPTGKKDQKVKLAWAYVWTRKGDTLEEKRILTGIDDETNVVVSKGLSAGELVITGIKTAEATTNKSQRSPFMPQMRRSAPANQPGSNPHSNQ